MLHHGRYLSASDFRKYSTPKLGVPGKPNYDPFGGAKPRFWIRGKESPLKVNPEPSTWDFGVSSAERSGRRASPSLQAGKSKGWLLDLFFSRSSFSVSQMEMIGKNFVKRTRAKTNPAERPASIPLKREFFYQPFFISLSCRVWLMRNVSVTIQTNTCPVM